MKDLITIIIGIIIGWLLSVFTPYLRTESLQKKLKDESKFQQIKNALHTIKSYWYIPIYAIILISITGLFIASFVLEKNIEVQTMNNWVSMILGIVATMLSIISLYLSFYNLEKEHELNKENTQILNNLEAKITEIPERTTSKLINSDIDIKDINRDDWFNT